MERMMKININEYLEDESVSFEKTRRTKPKREVSKRKKVNHHKDKVKYIDELK